MGATPKTYIPSILAFATWFKKFVNKNSATLERYMGEGLYSLVTFVVDLVIVLASIIDAGAPNGDDQSWSDFTAVNTLTSQQINQIEAAYQKFLASNGIVGGS